MTGRLRDDILSGIVSGVVAGGLLLLAANWHDDRQAKLQQRHDDQQAQLQQRLENLRFVREVARAQEGAMPFQSLDLKGMDLSGLRLACRDGDPPVESTTTSTSPVPTCQLRADFTGANLTNAIMRDMDLSDAVFTGAELGGTDFGGSKLSGAEFVGALNLDAKSLQGDPNHPTLGGVCYEGAPILPAGVELPPSDNGGNSPVCTDGYYAR
jgi:uncharacterized protein YjbI with pentapeptide repeats